MWYYFASYREFAAFQNIPILTIQIKYSCVITKLCYSIEADTHPQLFSI